MEFTVVTHQILCRGIAIPPHGAFVGEDGKPIPVREGTNPFDLFFRCTVFTFGEALKALPPDASDDLRSAVEWAPLPECADDDIAGARRDFFTLQVGENDATCCGCRVPHGHVYLMGRPISPPFLSKTQAFAAIGEIARWVPVRPERLEGLAVEIEMGSMFPARHLSIVR